MSILTRAQGPGLLVWPSFGRLFGLQNELDRLFDGSLGAPAADSPLFSAWNPAVDLYEDKDNIIVKAELPGMKKEAIDVSLHDGELSISGERKSEEKSETAETWRSERFIGRFNRTITLPTEVSADKVKADYKDGILTITLPKAEEAKPRQIKVSEG